MAELVTIQITDTGVADVRLNRPEKYNSLSPEMFDAVTAAGESLLDNADVRAVVLSGNGPGFCAGLDFTGFQQMASSGPRKAAPRRESTGRTPGNAAQQPGLVWQQIPVPVIAALHGVAYGGGFQIAMGADIRIAAPDAKLSVMEIKWGLIPDCSLSATLRDLVRIDIAKELTFTGRIFDGREAAHIGVVTQLNDAPLAAALEMAEVIAGKSPDAIRRGKTLFNDTWRGDEAEGLQLEQTLQLELIGNANQVEAVKANFEKRPPRFANPA